ncbi:MAG TPA: biopolymer transporter ExbD [Phycisphaerae bacterium]|nr:biopolymer transporter ExbD [Phycisphaerae bacterium]HNU43984.1 biopolymer transporter ExbD [Phycisphaerae bacterium]
MIRRPYRQLRRRPGGIGFNMTPMVDVIFTLTIFFMLISTFAERENRPLQLPKPTASQARSTRTPQRVVINCWPGEPGGAQEGEVFYSLGPNRPQPLATLSHQLGVLKEQTPDVQVVVRADRRLRYAEVRAVMQVVAEHQIEMLNVAAHLREEGFDVGQ